MTYPLLVISTLVYFADIEIRVQVDDRYTLFVDGEASYGDGWADAHKVFVDSQFQQLAIFAENAGVSR